MLRVRTVLSGWQGAPGLGTNYFLPGTTGGVPADAVDACGRVRAYWVAMAAMFPTSMGFQVSGAVDLIEDTNGFLVGGLAGGSPAGSSGSAAVAYAPLSSMVLLRMQTAAIRRNRRVAGRVFLGPVVQSMGTAAGVPTAAAGTAALAGAAALGSGATATHPVVWHRPDGSLPGTGEAISITGYQVGPEFAVLRSRRD